MKGHKILKQESALERRKNELNFWKSITKNSENIDVSKFGKSLKSIKPLDLNITEKDMILKIKFDDVNNIIKRKISICEKDINNLKLKLNIPD